MALRECELSGVVGELLDFREREKHLQFMEAINIHGSN